MTVSSQKQLFQMKSHLLNVILYRLSYVCITSQEFLNSSLKSYFYPKIFVAVEHFLKKFGISLILAV